MEDVGDEDEIALSREAWQEITRTGNESFLLDLAETDGMGAVTRWLDKRGLPWSKAKSAPRREGPRPRSPQMVHEARVVLGPPSPFPPEERGQARATSECGQ